MLGELAIGFDFNVRSWHRADKLTDLKVRYERRADSGFTLSVKLNWKVSIRHQTR